MTMLSGNYPGGGVGDKTDELNFSSGPNDPLTGAIQADQTPKPAVAPETKPMFPGHFGARAGSPGFLEPVDPYAHGAPGTDKIDFTPGKVLDFKDGIDPAQLFNGTDASRHQPDEDRESAGDPDPDADNADGQGCHTAGSSVHGGYPGHNC